MENKLHQSIIKNIPFAYAMHKIVIDDKGNPIDFEILEVNAAFETFANLKEENLIGKKITDLFHYMKWYSFDLIDGFINRYLSGGESEFIKFFEQKEKWYKVKLFSPFKGYVKYQN
jgi:PAS domain-containing protein